MWGERPLGARRLWALVKGLPFDSPLAREMDPEGVGSGWTLEAFLLATVAEILGNVYRKSGSPEFRIPRPGVTAKKRPAKTGQEVIDYLVKQGGRRKK